MSKEKTFQPGAVSALIVLVFTFTAPGSAQSQSARRDPAGHWDGHVELPSGPLEVHLDLSDANGRWSGDIVIPTESTRSMPVTAIVVSGRRVSFGVDMRGGPHFEGRLEKRGRELDGDFEEAGYDYPFKLMRAGAGGGR